MSSEITNVLTLVPAATVKADKRANENATTTRDELGVRRDSSTAVQNDVTVLSSQEDKVKKGENSAVTADSVLKAVDQGNSLLQAVNRNLQFKVDDATKELVVKIVDSESGDVVRQIPSEEMLTFIRRMQELDGQQGFVIQDRA